MDYLKNHICNHTAQLVSPPIEFGFKFDWNVNAEVTDVVSESQWNYSSLGRYERIQKVYDVLSGKPQIDEVKEAEIIKKVNSLNVPRGQPSMAENIWQESINRKTADQVYQKSVKTSTIPNSQASVTNENNEPEPVNLNSDLVEAFDGPKTPQIEEVN